MMLAKVLSSWPQPKEESYCNKKCWSIKVSVAFVFVFVIGIGLKHKSLTAVWSDQDGKVAVAKGSFMELAP